MFTSVLHLVNDDSHVSPQSGVFLGVNDIKLKSGQGHRSKTFEGGKMKKKVRRKNNNNNKNQKKGLLLIILGIQLFITIPLRLGICSRLISTHTTFPIIVHFWVGIGVKRDHWDEESPTRLLIGRNDFKRTGTPVFTERRRVSL